MAGYKDQKNFPFRLGPVSGYHMTNAKELFGLSDPVVAKLVGKILEWTLEDRLAEHGIYLVNIWESFYDVSARDLVMTLHTPEDVRGLVGMLPEQIRANPEEFFCEKLCPMFLADLDSATKHK